MNKYNKQKSREIRAIMRTDKLRSDIYDRLHSYLRNRLRG